ncbi:hypothetical protein SKAU_G00065900 [Synaphobranchus kaupii]|uniref:Uncharacterized protein n=1 Tax=Synaphobranchus kaupii TaxID=118154 RepID=A0A9Q1G7C3_SYNKA|nr:hypothetical protein SKAU_G00065900 [Synaphobranchus kaupii]
MRVATGEDTVTRTGSGTLVSPPLEDCAALRVNMRRCPQPWDLFDPPPAGLTSLRYIVSPQPTPDCAGVRVEEMAGEETGRGVKDGTRSRQGQAPLCSGFLKVTSSKA